MCDEATLRDVEDYLRRSGSLTRRKAGDNCGHCS